MTLFDTWYFCPLPSTTILLRGFCPILASLAFSFLRSLTSLSLRASLSPASKVTLRPFLSGPRALSRQPKRQDCTWALEAFSFVAS